MTMNLNVAQKLIKSHLISGVLNAGEEIGIRIDQTLTQDATGTLVMLELEAMGLDRAKTDKRTIKMRMITFSSSQPQTGLEYGIAGRGMG